MVTGAGGQVNRDLHHSHDRRQPSGAAGPRPHARGSAARRVRALASGRGGAPRPISGGGDDVSSREHAGQQVRERRSLLYRACCDTLKPVRPQWSSFDEESAGRWGGYGLSWVCRPGFRNRRARLVQDDFVRVPSRSIIELFIFNRLQFQSEEIQLSINDLLSSLHLS